MSRVPEWFATLATKHRVLTVSAFVAIAVGLGLAIPSLLVDPTPQRLTASSIADQERVAAEFRTHFGNPDHIVMVLVDADDVLAPEPLAYVHRLSSAFAAMDRVQRVESITATSLALPGASNEPEGSLEDLETLEELDDIQEPAVDPALEEALGALVRAAPERFPMGLGTLADRLGSIRFGPAIEGPTVEPEERETLLRALADAPLVEGHLISRDRRLAAIAVMLDDRVDAHEELKAAIEAIDGLLESTPRPQGVEVGVAGLPHYFQQIASKIQQDNLRMVPATLLVSLLLLYLSFRWWPGTLLPLAAVAVSTVALIGGMALFGETMNVINNILPALMVIIGVSEAIHVVGRYREEVRRGLPKLDAVRETVRHMTLAAFLTTATTAVGLASLVTSDTAMLRRFGVVSGIGVMIVYLATILFIPAALSFFPPPRPRDGRRLSRLADGWLDRAIVWMTRRILRRPWWYLAGATVLTVVCFWGAFQVHVDSALLDELEESDPLYQRTQQMEQQLDGVRPLEIMLSADDPARFTDPEVLRDIDELQAWLDRQRGVLSTLSPTDYLHESWARAAGDPEARTEGFKSAEQVGALVTMLEQAEESPLRTVLAEDGRAARIHVSLADIGASASLELIEALRERLRRDIEPHGLEVSMTGEGYTGSIGLEAIVNDFMADLSTAVFIIFGMVVVLFRSLRLGLLSVPPNVIPLVGALAWMSLRGIPLNAATVIIFSVSLGLAVDASIHIIARYREEVEQGFAWRVAILRSARGTGRSIVISFSTLMLGFGVLLWSSFVPVRRFGELLAVSMALSLLATLVVQPAMLRIGLKPKKAAGKT